MEPPKKTNSAIDKGFKGNKNGQPFKSLELSGQVEIAGAELLTLHYLEMLL